MATSRYRELTANTALFAISSFGSKLIQFFLLPLYTAVLSTEDYGTADLLVSTASLLIPVLTLNIQDAVLRFGLSDDAQPGEALSVGLRSVVGGSSVLLLALVAINKMGLVSLNAFHFVFLYAMFVLGCLNNILTMYLKSLNHVSSLVVSGVGNTLVTCVAAIVLLVIYPHGIAGYMVALVMGNLFSVFYLLAAGNVPSIVPGHVRAGLFRKMVAYSLPLVANGLAWWVSDLSDRYVVAFFCGAAANGIYAVAFKIPSILSTLQTVFYNAWSISAIKEYGTEDSNAFMGGMYELYSCAMSVCCSIIMLLDIPLARILYANEFFGAWQFVPFLLVGVLLNGLSLFEGCVFAAAKRTKEVAKTTVIGAAIGLASCIVLTQRIGVIGAAISTAIGYLVTWGIRTYELIKHVTAIEVSWMIEIASLGLLLVQASLAVMGIAQIAQLLLFVSLCAVQRGRIMKVVSFVLTKVFGSN